MPTTASHRLGQHSTLSTAKTMLISLIVREKKRSDSRWPEGIAVFISEFSVAHTIPTQPATAGTARAPVVGRFDRAAPPPRPLYGYHYVHLPPPPPPLAAGSDSSLALPTQRSALHCLRDCKVRPLFLGVVGHRQVPLGTLENAKRRCPPRPGRLSGWFGSGRTGGETVGMGWW